MSEEPKPSVVYHPWTEHKERARGWAALDQYERKAVVTEGPGETFYAEGKAFDPVNKPRHYNVHPSGVECIEITEHMGFCLGNAMKYIWRADEKFDAVEDLKKAAYYIQREIALRERTEDD